MAKGKCKRATIRVGKILLASVTVPGFRFIAGIVEILQQTDFSSSEKRHLAMQLAIAEAKNAGREAKEGAIRAAIEISVAALKQGSEEVLALGTLDVVEAEGVEMVEV